METGPGRLTAATGATITLKPAEQESKQNWGLKSDLLAAAKAAKLLVLLCLYHPGSASYGSSFA